jgi:predicted permease
MIHDLRFALRALWRTPVFTTVSVLMLAVGIGLSIYMFGAINAFALKPLPFADADRLVHVTYTERDNRERNLAVPQRDWLELRERQDVLESLAAYYTGTANLGGLGGAPERLSAAWISHDAFDVLGVRPLLGRAFSADDGRPGAARVVLLGQRVWQLHFNADPQVVGRSVRVNAEDVTVVGVMPEGFAFPVAEALWVPLSSDRVAAARDGAPLLRTFGRLRPGVTRAQAQAGFDALLQGLSAERGESLRGDAARVATFSDQFILPQIRHSTGVMFVAVLLVLLIACTNVASLVLARFTARARELGIRAALGASRRRLVVQVLAETFVIAALATVTGYVGADLVGRATDDVTLASGNLPYWVDFRVDGRDVLFCGAIAFAAALLAGLAPALRASRLDVQANLRSGGHAGPGKGFGRFLVSGEVALCVILLVCAGASIRSALQAQQVELGLQTEQVLTGRVALFESAYPDAAARLRFAEALEARLRTLPGVQASAIASTLPLMGYERQEYARDGEAVDAKAPLRQAWSTRVNAGFFATFGIALREGRLFDARDTASSAPVAIVSAAFAERAWPGQSALGQRVQLQPKDGSQPWLEVVGVVADSAQADYLETRATNAAHRGDGNVFRPLAQDPPAFVSLALRADGDAGALGEGVRQAVRAIDADLPVYWLRPMEEWRRQIFWGMDLLARMFGAFALFAVLLAAAGIYAVLTFDVAARTREIGVRRALGAPAHSVLAMVLRRGGMQVLAGIAVGVPLALAFSLLLGQMLLPGSPLDPQVHLAVIGVLLLVVVLAALLPARRALRVDPMVALRDE